MRGDASSLGFCSLYSHTDRVFQQSHQLSGTSVRFGAIAQTCCKFSHVGASFPMWVQVSHVGASFPCGCEFSHVGASFPMWVRVSNLHFPLTRCNRVEGKAKLTARKAYGLRTPQGIEIVLFHPMRNPARAENIPHILLRMTFPTGSSISVGLRAHPGARRVGRPQHRPPFGDRRPGARGRGRPRSMLPLPRRSWRSCRRVPASARPRPACRP